LGKQKKITPAKKKRGTDMVLRRDMGQGRTFKKC